MCLKLHYFPLKFRNGVKDTCQQGLNEEPEKSYKEHPVPM